jgi:hypothetical protein
MPDSTSDEDDARQPDLHLVPPEPPPPPKEDPLKAITREVVYSHSTLAQCCLPYRDPGDDVRVWTRENGNVTLMVEAGHIVRPGRDPLPVGLPFGCKPRLAMAFINAEAVRTQEPVVMVGPSLTSFVERVDLHHNGATIAMMKDQLLRLSAARMTFGVVHKVDGQCRTDQVKVELIERLELWHEKSRNGRVPWLETIRLGARYFETLMEHAVPLEPRALGALSNNGMALDCYCWLAQRSHRIDPRKPQRISWPALQAQFGWHYQRVRKFREVFLHALRLALREYPNARVEVDGHGLLLRYAPTPVPYKASVKNPSPEGENPADSGDNSADSEG